MNDARRARLRRLAEDIFELRERLAEIRDDELDSSDSRFMTAVAREESEDATNVFGIVLSAFRDAELDIRNLLPPTRKNVTRLTKGVTRFLVRLRGHYVARASFALDGSCTTYVLTSTRASAACLPEDRKDSVVRKMRAEKRRPVIVPIPPR